MSGLLNKKLSVGKVGGASFVVGAEATNVINVAVQLQDEFGADLANVAAVPFYFSDDAAGKDPTTTAHDGGSAIGTDGAMIEWTANLSGLLVSEADGDIDIDITDAGAFTVYLCLVLPDGSIAISGVITHAA
jgi:hypothetical protein